MALVSLSNAVNETMKNTPESLALYLRGMEEIYRSELTETEVRIYLDALKDYPMAEILGAGKQLMLQPIEGWTGIPKLPDYLRVLEARRIQRAEEISRTGGTSLASEDCSICNGTGWQLAFVNDKPTGRVRRCECWMKNYAAMNNRDDPK